MVPPPRPRLVLGALVWVLALVAVVGCLERPAPLFLNLGAGDASFIRGFRGRWERDGLTHTGETMFRWTLDGARIDFPVDVRGGRLTARLRLARFLDAPVAMTILVGGQEVDRWTQPPRGWTVRTVDLGEFKGPLAFQFRSRSGGDEMGVALDWVEVLGAGTVVPQPRIIAGVAALLLGVPLLIGLAFGRTSFGVAAGLGLAVVAILALALDRLGGLTALSVSGPPALVVAGLLALASRALVPWWPELVFPGPSSWGLSLGAAVLALVALSHPFFYYPDVDTHAQYLAAIRTRPYLAWDPTDYQLRTGSWTREIAGQRVAFPYSPVLHIAAWPLARPFGEVTAVKALAALALGLTTLLVGALARSLDLGPGRALVAQAIVVLLPVTSSRLTLALFPALLGQALDLLLLVHLVRRFPHLDGARDAGAAFLFMTLAQAAYTGSLLSVGAVLGLFALGELLFWDRRRAVRLLGAYAASAALVVGLLYARFLPTFFRDVLPHAREASEKEALAGGSLLGLATDRISYFFDAVYPLLLAPGLLALRGAAAHGRRLLVAILAAGGGLLVLRFAVPAVFRDAKDVELLAGPVAVVSAAGLGWVYGKGRAGQGAAVLLALGAGVWGISRAVEAYAERFLALGR